jgi:hypothetical protein
MQEIRDKKTLRHVENKSENDSKFFFMHTLNASGFTFSSPKTGLAE